METKSAFVCGHSRPMRYLERIKNKGVPASAFLFSGIDEVGKKTVALRFFSGLVCGDKNGMETGCGNCARCRAVASGTYPDLVVFEGQEEIGIAEIRELKRRLSLHSYAGSYRGALIDDAHRLTPDAQGAFLKILEEPAPATLFFLVTSRPQLLFETVRSRLLEIFFGPVSDDEMRKWTETQFSKSENIDNFLALAGGRPGRLKRFLENPELFTEEEKKLSKFEPLLEKPLVDQFLFSERLAAEDEEETRRFLQFLIGKVRGELFSTRARKEEVIEKLRHMLDIYFQLETTNANQRLLIDSAMIEAGEALSV